MGRWAPLVNVSLFSLYHFWSPWQIVARILGFGPTVYAVRWKRNVYLGMVVHCSLNTIAVAAGRVDGPRSELTSRIGLMTRRGRSRGSTTGLRSAAARWPRWVWLSDAAPHHGPGCRPRS